MNVELILALGLISLVVGLVIVFAWPQRLSRTGLAAGLIAIVGGSGAILWRAVVVLTAIALLVPIVAFAADGSTVQAGAPIGEALTIGEAVLVTLVGIGFLWLVYLAHRFLGVSIDAKWREALQGAIVNGIHREVEIVRARSAGVAIDVGHPALARVVNYVLTYSPQAAAHFGLTEQTLIGLIRAQLNRIMPPLEEAGR